jgi:hypothetical protein
MTNFLRRKTLADLRKHHELFEEIKENKANRGEPQDESS